MTLTRASSSGIRRCDGVVPGVVARFRAERMVEALDRVILGRSAGGSPVRFPSR
jgi:hypothetical protein